jgi:hypothetical protein
MKQGCANLISNPVERSMEKQTTLTKRLAIIGCIFLWLPLMAPVIFALRYFRGSGKFMLDFLMPFEIFPLVLLGSGLLIWAAIRSKLRVRHIGWAFSAAVLLMALGLVIAQVSGLASGRTAPDGTWDTIVTGLLIASDIALMATAVGGTLLVRDLIKKP